MSVIPINIMVPTGVNISQSDINSIVERILREVKPLVEKKFVEAINQYVYGAYSPTEYSRRYTLTNSTTLGTISGSTLSVVTTASSPGWGYRVSGMNFLGAIHNPGHLWANGFPRPANANAYQEYIDNDAEIMEKIQSLAIVYFSKLLT